MKEKQTEEGKKPSRDQSVNTKKTMMTNNNENEQEHESLQSGSGLLCVGNRKKKSDFTTWHTCTPEEKKDNVVDI